LDEKLEELPEIRDKLVEQYQKEKEESLKKNKNVDLIKERADENRILYKNSVESIENMEFKNKVNIVSDQEENMSLETVTAVIRKR
jgi:hypothetical protein